MSRYSRVAQDSRTPDAEPDHFNFGAAIWDEVEGGIVVECDEALVDFIIAALNARDARINGTPA